jgi:hypothetical protein
MRAIAPGIIAFAWLASVSGGALGRPAVASFGGALVGIIVAMVLAYLFDAPWVSAVSRTRNETSLPPGANRAGSSSNPTPGAP